MPADSDNFRKNKQFGKYQHFSIRDVADPVLCFLHYRIGCRKKDETIVPFHFGICLGKRRNVGFTSGGSGSIFYSGSFSGDTTGRQRGGKIWRAYPAFVADGSSLFRGTGCFFLDISEDYSGRKMRRMALICAVCSSYHSGILQYGYAEYFWKRGVGRQLSCPCLL